MLVGQPRFDGYAELSDLLRQPDCPAEVCHFVTRVHFDAHLAVVAVHHPSCPLEDIIALAESDDPYARLVAACSERLPQEILGRLAKDEDDRVRDNVASNPQTPPSALASLLRHGRAHPALLVSNPSIPAGALAAVQVDDVPVWQMIRFLHYRLVELAEPSESEFWALNLADRPAHQEGETLEEYAARIAAGG